MSSDNYSVIGKCMDMCPTKERLTREREGILHKFELADSTEGARDREPIRTAFQKNRARKALRHGDVSKVVKAFARSAAGLDKTTPEDLRPAHILEKTVEYLYTKILVRRDESYPTIYDFIFDRLRSVRQDLTIQRIANLSAIRILESMVRFHVYSAYRCRHEPLAKFDPHTNHKHLIDNLKRLLSLYQLNDYRDHSRNEFEALYVILCPDSAEVLSRALELCHFTSLETDMNYKNATEMALSFQFRNYVVYFRRLKSLPPLLAAAGLQHVRKFRGQAFQSISKAYGASTCKFPVPVLQSVLLYPTPNQLEGDLASLSVTVPTPKPGEVKHAVFSKLSVFDANHLSRVSSDFDAEPRMSRDKNLFHPDQVERAAEVIWPHASNRRADCNLARDWFSDGENSESKTSKTSQCQPIYCDN